jgi:hypothetical protein
MAGFEEISDSGGVDVLALPFPFMTVPLGGTNYIIRSVARGARLPVGDHFVDVKDITDVAVHQIATAVNQGFLTDQVGDSLRAFAGSPKDKRLLAIKGKIRGLTTLSASSGGHYPPDNIEVAVLRPKTMTLSFKFLNYLDQSGNQTSTRFKSQDATDILDSINTIYWQQAAITFDLKHADPLPLNGRFGTINQKIIENTLSKFLDKSADTTVFMAPNFEEDGRTIPGKPNLVVIKDDPIVPRTHDDIDPHTLVLAHELAHCLGFLPEITSRNGVLLSDGIQSLKIMRRVVEAINPWK